MLSCGTAFYLSANPALADVQYWVCNALPAKVTSPVTAVSGGMLLGFVGLRKKLLAPEPIAFWLLSEGFYLDVCQLVAVLHVF